MANTPNYDVNYDDKRFQKVETDKSAALNDMENTYQGMIDQSDGYFQKQIDATEQWGETQAKNQQAQTDFAIEKIEQQKQQTEQDYHKEQSASYADWQKQSNQYGANAEQMAAQGMQNTGYSESAQVAMYNQYQTRVAVARQTVERAKLNYDNQMNEARLQNNAVLAEIAFNTLQTSLELGLQGFQYKNTLLLDKMNKKQELENQYYQRYQDVLNQINTENQMKENARQFNETMAENKRQYDQTFAENKRQYDQSFAEDQRQYNESLAENKRQHNETLAENKRQHNETLAENKRQHDTSLAENKRQYEKSFKENQRQFGTNAAYQKQQLQLEKDKFAFQKKQYADSKSSGGTIKKSSGGSSSSSKGSSSSSKKSSSTKVKTFNKSTTKKSGTSGKDYLNALIRSGANEDKVANEISLALRKGAISRKEAADLRKAFTPRGVRYN